MGKLIKCTMHPVLKLFKHGFKNYTACEIKETRARMQMSQTEFADLFHATKDTVKGWECGRRHPSCSSMRLLQIIESVANERHADFNHRLRRTYRQN